MNLIQHLEDLLIQKSQNINPDKFLVRGAWEFTMRAQPNNNERIFSEFGLLIATSSLGSSFKLSHENFDFDNIISLDARFVRTESLPLKVALIDSCYGNLVSEESYCYQINGCTTLKSKKRASIISEAVMDLNNKPNPRILMVGVVNSIVDNLISNGATCILSDLDDKLINQYHKSAIIHHGNMNTELINECDVLLITGMAITTQTLGRLLVEANEMKKPVVIFAQTGSNFASEYLELGADCVIAEKYPWYCIPGRSDIKIYKKKVNG